MPSFEDVLQGFRPTATAKGTGADPVESRLHGLPAAVGVSVVGLYAEFR